MNRPLSWLIVVGLAVGICACDKKDGVPMPKTGTGEVKRQAKEAVGAAEKRFHNDSFFVSLRRGAFDAIQNRPTPLRADGLDLGRSAEMGDATWVLGQLGGQDKI